MKLYKKIRKTGGSYSVILPVSVLKLFDISSEIEMEINSNDQTIVIRKKTKDEDLEVAINE
jgi:antitoxin component of MazEF toxin-antitoxin module